MQTLNSGLMPVADAYSTLKSAESCIVYGAWYERPLHSPARALGTLILAIIRACRDVGNLVNSTIYPSGSGQYLCDSQVGPVRSELWSTTCTFPIYVIALITICGWLLFMVFAGVGFIALPVDLIRTYKNRPMQTITKSEYMRLGQEIGLKAKTTLNKLKAIQLDEKRNGKTRKTKKAAQALLGELTQLEDEDYRLREIYPQSENRADEWAITVLSYFFSGVFGVVSVCLTGCWLAHLVVYEFVVPPLSPMLNEMFVEMDSVFGLFGTAAFAVFCFYLVVCTMKGNLKLGMNFLIFTVHPMKVGDTLMSSFLFNTGLIMLCSISIIQFCSQVFDQYAAETAIDEIFGNQVFNLRGIGYLFRYGAFLYCLFSISMLTMLITPFLRVAKYKPKKNVADDDD